MAKALQAYRAKRDFARTPEPGAARSRSGKQLSFVVQKHAATRLHWDLRLEWRGVLKSWAVTNEPVQDPAIKRLAVEVEDHPLAYGTFEGSIPKGQYGGGTVEIWDRGVWAPLDPKQVDADLAAGHLKFVLAGGKMQGGFALIRMKPKSNERNAGRNWLLIKERDDYAAAAPPAIAASPSKPKAGPPPEPKAARPSKPKADPPPEPKAAPPPAPKRAAAAPGFLPMQHCLVAETPPTGKDWLHELKLDGYRLQIAVAGGKVVLRTRTGLDWTTRFPAIAEAAARLPDVVLDGEAVALNAEGLPDFAALQSTLGEGRKHPLAYFAFDLLREGARDLRPLTQRERKARLRKLLDDAPGNILRYTEDFAAAGEAVLRSACQLAMEGVVSKRGDKPYREGRSGNWVKTKCRGNEEVVVGGWSRDRHGRGIGALLVGARREGKLVYLGRVGTGFGASTSRDLLDKLAPLERKTTPFEGKQPARTNDVQWARPELVAQVAFAGWTEEGLLRHASFIALREDKPLREVEVPSTPTKPEATKPQAAKTGSAKPAARSAARLTHPERVLWPAVDGQPDITKAMLAEYYARLAPLLLPHLRGRPLSILRTPDGIDSERFFQRHAMPGISPLLKQVRIPGQPKPYLMIEDEGGLLALAQISATELHPWGAMGETPDQPDRLVFDLDPGPGVEFPAIRDAARRVRDLLGARGLTGFPRISGGKGIHVVVPIAAPRRGAAPDWPRAKAFALELCRVLEKEDPAHFTTRMAKSARDGRIFLDYLRNDRLSTAIASWSPRARSGAPVSRPLSWAALARVDRADGVRIPALLAGRLPTDPWTDFAAAAAPLPT